MLGKSERNNPYAHTAKHIERKSRFVISSQSRIDTGVGIIVSIKYIVDARKDRPFDTVAFEFPSR